MLAHDTGACNTVLMASILPGFNRSDIRESIDALNTTRATATTRSAIQTTARGYESQLHVRARTGDASVVRRLREELTTRTRAALFANRYDRVAWTQAFDSLAETVSVLSDVERSSVPRPEPCELLAVVERWLRQREGSLDWNLKRNVVEHQLRLAGAL